MKTLAEHNKEAMESYGSIDDLRRMSKIKNNIACPTCGYELFDTEPHYVLASYPPKLKVHCEKCGYSGYRIK